jgi:hypothetical protein
VGGGVGVFVGTEVGDNVLVGATVGVLVNTTVGVPVATAVGVPVTTTVGVPGGTTVGVPGGTSVDVPGGTSVDVPLATTVRVTVPVGIGVTVALTATLAVSVGAAVLVAVAVGVVVNAVPRTVALAQSFATLPAASLPPAHMSLVDWPGSTTVVDTDNCVDAPAAKPLPSDHSTYPVAGLTAPWLVALTKARPLGSADATCRLVRSVVPVLVIV